MPLISSALPNLINGVSQQPPALRLPSQGEVQENGLSSVVDGLTKRPATRHIATLSNIPSAVSSAFLHTIRRGDNLEFYSMVITAGSILVYDELGVQQTVNPTTGALNYLSGISDPASQVTATTIADFTFIVNKNKVVAKSTAKHPARNPEALVYIKQADYSSEYELTITKGGSTRTQKLTTKSSSQADTAATQNAEQSIQTDRIAQNLRHNVTVATSHYDNVQNAVVHSGLTYTLYGNVIYIQGNSASDDFEVSVKDSNGNQDIFAYKGQTGDFKKLPPDGPAGFVVQIIGDNAKNQDDYYVQLSVGTNGTKFYKECAKPDSEKDFDNTTMPHVLIREANGTFTFKPNTWDERKVGDEDTNPFPSFIGFKINDIFFHRNRLGFLSDENVIFSQSAEYYNFFNTTTLTFVESNPIDVAVSNNQISILKQAIPFSESLLLFSDLNQFRLSAGEILAADTVAVDVTTQFEADLLSKPVGAGKYVYFATKRGDFGGVREYFVETDTETNDAADITAHVPTYIEGQITKLAASSNEDLLLMLTDGEKDVVYVYKWYFNKNEKLQSSWSKFKIGEVFKAKDPNATVEILQAEFDGSEIVMLVKYVYRKDSVGNSGSVSNVVQTDVCLERLQLSRDVTEDQTDDKIPVLLDRRFEVGSGGSYTTGNSFAYYYNDDTGTRQSFNVAYDGPASTVPLGQQYATTMYPESSPNHINSFLTFVSQDGSEIPAKDVPQAITDGKKVWGGLKYTFKYQFSEQVIKNNNVAITTGRMQIRNFHIVFSDTSFFKVKIRPDNRNETIKTFTGRVLGSEQNKVGVTPIATGSFKVPVLAESSKVTITIESDSHLPCAFQSAEYEAMYKDRTRRL